MYNILEVFEYNQHFVAMMNIINAARLNPPTKGHKHHIIPRCWFKMNNLPVDNSKDNLILLTLEDHIKVHKLASLCSVDTHIKYAMLSSIGILSRGERPLGIHPSEATKAKIRKTVHEYYESNKDLHSERTKKGMERVDRDKLAYWKGKNRSEESINKTKISVRQIVNIAKHKYKEYKANGGVLMWNAWRHEEYGRT